MLTREQHTAAMGHGPLVVAGTRMLARCVFGRIKTLEANDIMLDIIFIAATTLFFAAAVLYVRGCERLR